jgi:hypothetical protein
MLKCCGFWGSLCFLDLGYVVILLYPSLCIKVTLTR